MSSHLLRFGVLWCPTMTCMRMREFVSYDKDCKHITDAFCCECGYVFGRVDQWDERAGLRAPDTPGVANPVTRRGVPVVSDAMAAAAAARLGHGAADVAAAVVNFLPRAPDPWRPGRFAKPSDNSLPAPAPTPASSSPPRPPSPRPRPAAPPDTAGSRTEEFMRQYAARSTHGRT
jgi:hypothetical protein